MNIPPSHNLFFNTIYMELGSMLLKMQMFDEPQKELFFIYASDRTIFIRKCEATNNFRLMMPSVDRSDSNELMTQRPVASSTDAAWSDWLASTTGVCLFDY